MRRRVLRAGAAASSPASASRDRTTAETVVAHAEGLVLPDGDWRGPAAATRRLGEARAGRRWDDRPACGAWFYWFANWPDWRAFERSLLRV